MQAALLGGGTFYATPGDGYPASVVPLPEQGELFVPLIPVTVAVQMLMRDFEAMKRPGTPHLKLVGPRPRGWMAWMRESRPDPSSDASWASPRSDPKTFLLQSRLKLVSFSCSQPLPGCFKRSPLRSTTTKTSLTPPGWVHLTTHKKPHPTPFRQDKFVVPPLRNRRGWSPR